MTKKDFILIAKIISLLEIQPKQKEYISIRFAKELQYTNTAFRYDHFIKECLKEE